jgi:tRNA-binding protein
MEIDFGPGFGVRRSSAQLTDLYRPEDLEGRQVVALVDLGEKRIAGYVSQVLVLGVQTDAGVALLAPDRPFPMAWRCSEAAPPRLAVGVARWFHARREAARDR